MIERHGFLSGLAASIVGLFGAKGAAKATPPKPSALLVVGVLGNDFVAIPKGAEADYPSFLPAKFDELRQSGASALAWRTLPDAPSLVHPGGLARRADLL